MASIKQAIKAKIKHLGEKSDDKSESGSSISDIHVPESLKEQQPEDTESALSAVSALVSESDVSESSLSFDDVTLTSADDVQDLSNTQLQDLLISAILKNQELEKDLRDQKKVQELYDHEKGKSKALEGQLREFVRQHNKRAPPPAKDKVEDEYVDVAMEMKEETKLTPQEREKLTWGKRTNLYMMESFRELLRDFTDLPDGDEAEEEEQLAIKTLKANITRFKEDIDPIIRTISGMRNLFGWQYPTATAVTFFVYMYAVWYGWLVPLVLLLFILRLTINFMNSRGWNIQVNFIASYNNPDKDKDQNNFNDMGVSDKLTVVLQVATKVQNTLGAIADTLEKLWNLFTWKQSEATIRLYFGLCGACFLSSVLPGTVFFMMIGLYLGFKMFVIEFIYLRFPRFKQRHDTVYIIWQALPTNADLKARNKITQQKDSQKQKQFDNVSESSMDAEVQDLVIPSDLKQFCDIFSLPYDECPLPDWREGKGCAMIDKDKGFRHGFKYGKLFLTKSYLCYERHKKKSPKNFTIPLADVKEIRKVKPFSWLPGSGMSLEISVFGFDKPVTFGAMMSRDEVFDNIVAHGLSSQLEWANRAWDERNKVWQGSKENVKIESHDDESGSGGDNENKEKGDSAHGKEESANESGSDMRHRSVRMSEIDDGFS